MKVFPYGEFILCFFGIIFVLSASIAVGFLMMFIVNWIRIEILWNSRKGIMIKRGNKIPIPWYLKGGNIVDIVAFFVSLLLTAYALGGPLYYSIVWLRN